MAILFMLEGEYRQRTWRDAFLNIDPSLDIRIWPDIKDKNDIDFAFVWRAVPGELAKLPNLRCIASLGAGVDYILADPKLPQNVPVVRIIDERLMLEMAQYVIHAVVHYTKHMDIYHNDQKLNQWRPLPEIRDINVGIMGLGQMGLYTAKQLKALGFNVLGWRHSNKRVDDIKCYFGEADFAEFLANSHILVCMLPLTDKTQGILNQKTFNQLPKGAYVINVGRGGHLLEKDLLDALNSGQLSGACIDVFPQEPLSESNPLWLQKNLRITPHIASVTDPISASERIVENYQRMLKGDELLSCVDRQKGY